MTYFPPHLPAYSQGRKGTTRLAKVIVDAIDEMMEHLAILDPSDLVSLSHEASHYWPRPIDTKSLMHKNEAALHSLAVNCLIANTEVAYYDPRPYIRPDYSQHSEVLEKYPELAAVQDEEGLVPLSVPGFIPFDSGISYKGDMLHYHQFLIRGFVARPNFDFLSALAKYQIDHPEQRIVAAIDHFRLVPKAVVSRAAKGSHTTTFGSLAAATGR